MAHNTKPIKKVIAGLKKAVTAHGKQAKTLSKVLANQKKKRGKKA